MIKTDGPGLFLPASDCALLDRALRDALKFGWLGRRAVPPHALVALADLVHATAEEYQPQDRSGPVTSRTGPVSTRTTSTSTASEAKEVLLTTAEAAQYLGLTEGHVRKLARKSAIPAEQGAGGTGWKYRRDELAAWKADREETHERAA